MTCPSCGQRKGRRSCPALGELICTACCGTKRLVEIHCPDTCDYLIAAREHPAAVVRRRQERDVAALLPVIQHLTERQHQLFFLFHSLIAQYQPEGLLRLADTDVAEAAGALAATLETASRGVLYEHTPPSPLAQQLAGQMRALLEEVKTQGARIYEGEVAITLRAIEQGARGRHRAGSGEPDAYLALMGRLLQGRAARPALKKTDAGRTSLILP
jgi:hypothetical protein